MKVHMDKELLSLLRRLGLNQYESRLYLALLNFGASTASDLSDTANIPRPRAYDVLDKLEKKGFVAIQPGRPTRFAAVMIDEAFENLRKKKHENLEKELEEVGKIQNQLKRRIKSFKPIETKGVSDFVWVLRSRDNIYSKLESLIENAKNTIIIATSNEGLKRKLDAYEKHLKRAKKRGVNIKIITPSDTKYSKKASQFAEVINRDHKHRFTIADDDVLLFLTPEIDEKKEVGAWIKSSFFADNLRRSLT